MEEMIINYNFGRV